jgi:hypothetical protein
MRYLIVVVLFAGLAACSESKPPPKTVFDPQLQALEKARAVQGQVDDSARREREAIEKSTGNPSSAASGN